MEANDTAKVQRLMSAISSNTQKIGQNANQVSAMIQLFGTPRDSLAHREKTFDVVSSTGKLAKDTFRQIKELNNYTTIINRDKQLKLQKERITDAYTKSLNALQENEKKLAAQKPIAVDDNKPKNDANNMILLDLDNKESNTERASFANRGFEQRQAQLQMDDQIRAAEEQNEAMKNLEKDIVDVNAIFKDLAILVHDQGEVIDNIESNIENTATRVTNAREELEQAQKHQQKVRKRKMVLFGIGIGVLVFIILLIYLSARHK